MRHALRALTALGLAALLYTGPAHPANAGDSAALPVAELRALATGQMETLEIHEIPKPRMAARFALEGQGEIGIEAFEGKVVVLNFWATWCPPCLREMPSLDALSAAMAEHPVEVVAVSADFGGTERPRHWLDANGIEHLELYHDPQRALAKESGLIGLPVTLILDRQGRELARLVGDAHWDAAEAQALILRIAELTAPDS
ncbi:MAG: TlpA disulfide reductase family protein [Pikeienuella sp.]